MGCLLQHYLREAEGFDDSMIQRYNSGVIADEYYQISDSHRNSRFRIRCGAIRSGVSHPSTDYIFIPAISPFSSLSHLMPIKIRGNEVGWIVPLQCIMQKGNAEESFESNMDLRISITSEGRSRLREQARVMLDEVTLALLMDDSCISFSTPEKGDSYDLSFSHLYDPKTVVIVLDSARMPSESIVLGAVESEYLSGIKAVLHLNGYITQQIRSESFYERISWTQSGPNLNILEISPDLRDEAYGIALILAHSFHDTSSVGVFVGLYQVIEVLSAIVFRRFLEVLRNVNPDIVDPFEYRKLLSEVNSQRKHVEYILDYYWHSTNRGALKNEVLRAAEDFLESLNQKLRKRTCDRALYKLRTNVVHRQTRWRGNFATEQVLHDFNLVFRKLLLDLLSNFNLDLGDNKLSSFLKTKLET